ncbi:MAG: hypothetical protein RQ715_04055 [Methylococcales bacterium]|nr:hypothetical protein [Methylococcales bacterium]
MNKLPILPCLSVIAFNLSSPVSAQVDLQKMMQQAQQMQVCMAGIDTDYLERLSTKAESVHSRVKQLCSKGQRDKAMSEALAFAQTMNNDAEIQKLRQCGDIALSMASQYQFLDLDNDSKRQHVCDE